MFIFNDIFNVQPKWTCRDKMVMYQHRIDATKVLTPEVFATQRLQDKAPNGSISQQNMWLTIKGIHSWIHIETYQYVNFFGY